MDFLERIGRAFSKNTDWRRVEKDKEAAIEGLFKDLKDKLYSLQHSDLNCHCYESRPRKPIEDEILQICHKLIGLGHTKESILACFEDNREVLKGIFLKKS